MDYHYETLNGQRFQKLCQALIVAQNPNTQCLPVGQSDGGRDAFFFHAEPDQANFAVFQVKFSLHPDSKTERNAIDALIKSEQGKVKELILRGATHYYFLTNIHGTAHPGAGSIDKANEALTKAFGIPAQVWWRDDLDRRLDNSDAIKWSYPEILKATDLLFFLTRLPGNTQNLQSARTLKSYMASQYEADKDVKFKQVDLKCKLTDLFVDLPLGCKRQQAEQDPSRFYMGAPGDIDTYVRELDFFEDYGVENESPFDHAGLAGAFLLQMPLSNGVLRFVLEGAPGQGKSTVTQFLCQVNRGRLLKNDSDLETVADAHKIAPARAPFRVDLRDYATWVSGRHPFTNTGKQPVPELRSLESFLVMQVNWESGGLKITQDELLQFFSRSHSVVILDGFDEVADIGARKHIVDEICKAATRLNAHTKSMQIIVTSRPAAFATSPGFPEDDWIHLELKDLRRNNIEAYKDKWIEAQGLSDEEGRQVTEMLHKKLDQPHLRDLARNPMQLAILLHLIHVQGVALPEKRTTLYEEYMKLFFNREAEKSTVVRDHRELLLSIHGMLAWILHTQAEEGAGSGRISKAELRNLVRTHLVTEGHDQELAGALFEGTVERIGALVSRVQGMYEFEVQPLREYFAARHLYKTAPYSPAGHERKGTKPERFEALACSFYWTNATRFFCGFYDVGELGSLVDGITGLGGRDGYNLVNQPRRLAMMLLSDRVFSQAPRTMKRLIDFVVLEPGFQRLTSTESPQSRREMSLPARVGASELFEACAGKLKVEDDPSRRRALRETMAENADQERLKSIWTSRFKDGSMRCDPLREAMDFGVVSRFTTQEIENLAKNDVDFHSRWLVLANCYDAIREDPRLHNAAKVAFFDGRLELPHQWYYPADWRAMFGALTELLQPYVLAALFSEQEATMPAYSIFHRIYFRGRRALDLVSQKDAGGVVDPLQSFTLFVLDLLNKEIGEWHRSLEPWTALVDRGFDEVPCNYLMIRTAMIATASNAEATSGRWDEAGFTATKGLVSRLFYARHKGADGHWWRAKLADVTPETVSSCLAVLLSWGAPDAITALKDDIDPIIDKLPSHDWSRLRSMTDIFSRAIQARPAIPKDWFDAAGSLSPRMALILIDRVEDPKAARRLSRNHFYDYAGDDAEILERAATIELFGSEAVPIDWNYVRHLSKRARQIGVHTLFPELGELPSGVPDGVAKDVLSDCESHCAQLVAICEQAYAATIAQAAPIVSHLAETDRWFGFPE